MKNLLKSLKNLDISLGGDGLSFCDVLFFIFLTLKLTGTINWGWGFIFLPIIVEVILMFIAAIIFVVICASREDEKAGPDEIE